MQSQIISKLTATSLNFAISIVLGVLVPRFIGPEAYGNYSYVVATYSFLFQFLMFTSNTAYIYFLSTGEYKIEDINATYTIFLLLISALTFFLSILAGISDLGLRFIWNYLDDYRLLSLGFFVGLFINFQTRLIEFCDCTKQTALSETLKLLSRLLMLVALLILIYAEKLDVYSVMFLSVLSPLFFLALFFKYVDYKIIRIKFGAFCEILKGFFNYLKPLFLFSLVATFYSYFGKYVLQSTGGPIEQGLFNFSLQFALIPVTFIASLMAIYLSEMTKKFGAEDLDGLKVVFKTNMVRLYAVHASISFYMLVNAKEIVLLTVGDAFIDAVGPLRALSIFSLLHTFGLLGGNLFHSGGRNKLYSIINVSVMFIGIICLFSFFVKGNLTASNLAVLSAFFYGLRVLIQLYFNMKYLSICKTAFSIEIALITIVTFSIIKFIHILGFGLLLNSFLVGFLLLFMNFLVNDYLGLRSLWVHK